MGTAVDCRVYSIALSLPEDTDDGWRRRHELVDRPAFGVLHMPRKGTAPEHRLIFADHTVRPTSDPHSSQRQQASFWRTRGHRPAASCFGGTIVGRALRIPAKRNVASSRSYPPSHLSTYLSCHFDPENYYRDGGYHLFQKQSPTASLDHPSFLC